MWRESSRRAASFVGTRRKEESKTPEDIVVRCEKEMIILLYTVDLILSIFQIKAVNQLA